jgi:hypothetical protein
MKENQDGLASIQRAVIKLYSEWFHKALPNGEYPKTVDELTAAYPDLSETFEIEYRMSQYTKEMAVMIKARPIV